MVTVLVAGWLLTRVRFENGTGWSLGLERWREPSAVGPRDRLVRAYVYLLFLTVIPGAVYTLSYFRYNTIPHCTTTSATGLEVPTGCQPGAEPQPPLRLARLGPVWVPTGLDPGGYIHQLIVHDQWAYDYHAHLTATHTYGSAWYSWPFLLRPVAYYYQDNLGHATGTGATLRAEVFNLGNPAIWWFSIPCLIYCAAVAVRQRNFTAAFIVVALLTAWLPFSRVSRVLFLYHMFGGLSFMMLAVAFTLSRIRPMRLRLEVGGLRSPEMTGTHLAVAYLGLVAVVFIFFYPLWTALPLTGDGWTQRIWFNLPDLKINWI
jgi:hypothetical protein